MATMHDPTIGILVCVIHYVWSASNHDLQQALTPYWTFFDELYIENTLSWLSGSDTQSMQKMLSCNTPLDRQQHTNMQAYNLLVHQVANIKSQDQKNIYLNFH